MTDETAAPDGMLARIERRVRAHGLRISGGFDLAPGESPGYRPETDAPVRSVLLIGQAGPGLWSRFARAAADVPDPLDTWCREILLPLAHDFEGAVVMPSDGPPYAPFQRWALRSGTVHPSPLGLLIDPVWGLWHAWRGALLLPRPLGWPAAPATPSPCTTCSGRPCLAACPVGAFSGDGFDEAACRAHLASPEGGECRDEGCRARRACPVGAETRYGRAQMRFHMRAYIGGT